MSDGNGYLHFSVTGELLTTLIRRLYWEENQEYPVVEARLLDCIDCSELSEEEMKQVAQDVIYGRKKFTGVNDIKLEPDTFYQEKKRYRKV